DGVASEAATLRLGQDQTRAFLAGVAGSTGSGSAVLIDPSGQLGTIPSARHYKRAIQDIGARSRGLSQLRPVTFRYRRGTPGVRGYGVRAGGGGQGYPELVVRGAKGEVEAVQYHELIPMLLNELQQRQRVLRAQAQQVAELRAQNARLQAVLVRRQGWQEERDAQNAALAARLEQLEA